MRKLSEDNKGGIILILVWFGMVIMFIVTWIVIDTVDLNLRPILNELVDDLNETYNTNPNDTATAQLFEEYTFMDKGVNMLKAIYFWGGILILLVSGMMLAYKIKTEGFYQQQGPF